MLTIYDESSTIIAFRKSLFSDVLKEEETLSLKIDACKESRGKELYFPPYIDDSSKEGDAVRYCFDQNRQLRIIQAVRKEQTVNAVYFLDIRLFSRLQGTLQRNFRFAAYSYLYSILNDERNTLYNVKIAADQSPDQKLAISYDEAGDLKRIYFKGEEDIVLYESLSDLC